MGDVERMWRKKQKLRNLELSDEENFDCVRPYFGNPFKAPGSIGYKSSKAPQNLSLVMRDERLLEEETYISDELSLIGEQKDLKEVQSSS